MLQVLPFLPWLATATSATLLIVLWRTGELSPRTLVVLLAWFGIAACCEFGPFSTGLSTTGLVFQTILAILLIVRWRLAS